jgi:hypothetical protein
LRHVSVLVVFIVAGCDLTEPICTADFRYGLSVAVGDSITRVTPDASILVVATDGFFTDSARIQANVTGAPRGLGGVALAGERSGRFDLRVTAPDYRPWTRQGIVVGRDECHVQGVTVEAWLQR